MNWLLKYRINRLKQQISGLEAERKIWREFPMGDIMLFRTADIEYAIAAKREKLAQLTEGIPDGSTPAAGNNQSKP